jgi:ribonucleotide reductase alpha subunit
VFFKGYLPLKIGDVIAERPQQMYVRIALSVTDTDEDFIEYLDLSSQKKVQQHL